MFTQWYLTRSNILGTPACISKHCNIKQDSLIELLVFINLIIKVSGSRCITKLAGFCNFSKSKPHHRQHILAQIFNKTFELIISSIPPLFSCATIHFVLGSLFLLSLFLFSISQIHAQPFSITIIHPLSQLLNPY